MNKNVWVAEEAPGIKGWIGEWMKGWMNELMNE